MTALWIVLGILALPGLLLLLPLRITLRYCPEGGFSYCVRLLVFPLVSSDREKKPKKEKKAPAKSAKPQAPAKKKSALPDLLSLLGLGEVSTAARAKAAVAERGLPEVLGDVAAAVRRLLAQTGRCLGAGVFERFALTVVIGGDDAAEAAFSYGAACAAVYSLVSLLEQSMTVHRRRVAVEIDYTQEQSRVALDLRLRYRMWRFVRYLFFLLGNYLKKERKPS